VGGHFAPELKRAGYDHIILSGKADRPVVLFIKDDEVRFIEASHIWGVGIQDTSRQIRKQHNDSQIRMASIGPAGENLVSFACIIVDEGRAAGFSGCGAVMGSKNLKSIAVRGTQEIPVAHPAFLKETALEIRKRIDSSPDIHKMREGGTHLLSAAGGPTHSGPQGTRNLQDGFWSKEKSKKVKEPEFRPFEINKLACFNCTIHCSHLYEIPDGENKGKQTEGIQANTVRAFGSNLDIDDPKVILEANFLCNDLGLDVDGTGAALGWTFECFENGMLTKQDTGGIQCDWGNGKSALSLIKQIALRQGVGDLLAQGVQAAGRTLGRGSEEHAMQIKGAPVNESCMRTHKGWALGIVTSTRGAGHLRGAPNTEQKTISPEISGKLWGIPNADDPGSYEGKAELVAWFEAFKAVVDALGLCYFATYWRDVQLIGPKDMSDLLYGATGIRMEEKELLRTGEKIVNIEKAFNTLHAGFSRKDDLPPKRLQQTSVSQGPFKGEHLDSEKWDTMLDEYYDCHGWDKETGRQTAACLDALQLPAFIKERLKSLNRLVE
jgi:aldehyde:ferredoxin oxidoreductase